MSGSGELILGACAAVLDRPLFARMSLLQLAAQTVPPHYQSIVASRRLDWSCCQDLASEATLLSRVSDSANLVQAYTAGLDELYTRGVNLFFCLDHDCIYRRGYIEAVCDFVYSAGLNADEGMFCLNLVDQEWLTLYDDDRGELVSHGFHKGLGLPPEEEDQLAVGAPPTFVFGRGAAQIVIEAARKAVAVAPHPDMFWRRVLRDSGIWITQVPTAQPVFAYVRRTNNLCWDGQPLGPKPRVNGHAPAASRNGHSRVRADALPPQVSVVIPTYNEGAWLERTVESIRGARTELRYEIIVVDDGCTDGSVEPVWDLDGVRVVPTGGQQLGLVVAKNAGARAARSRYLCFIDSHVLVHDYWLDCLRETCDAYPDGALVSGNLPDTTRISPSGELDNHQYGYMIRNCFLGTGWYFYGCPCTDQPYLEPLTPGGLTFTRKAHFARLGGFDPILRKWGAEDVQISLQNYCLGGENVVDPRVVVYHYYKNNKDRKRTFVVTNPQHAFNCLHVAAVYFPYDYYWNVRQALTTRGGLTVVGEIENDAHRERRERMQAEFIRGFDTWTVQFGAELRGFLADAARLTREAPPPYWTAEEAVPVEQVQ